MKPIPFIFSLIASLLLIIAVLFTSLQLCMNEEGWYFERYSEYGLAEKTGISTEDMTRAIMRLVDYMEGKVESIDLEVVENGETVSMYNERERLHMLDVRALYQAWRSVRNFALPAAAILFIAALALAGEGRRLQTASRGYVWASAAFGAVLAALGAWVVADFNSFWTAFHHLFFTNDLWLLSYATDRMIRICPAQLFSDIVIRFALMFLIPFMALFILALIGRRRAKA